MMLLFPGCSAPTATGDFYVDMACVDALEAAIPLLPEDSPACGTDEEIQAILDRDPPTRGTGDDADRYTAAWEQCLPRAVQHADGVCTATRDIQAYRGWDMGYQQGWDVGRDCEEPRTIHPSAPGTRRWYRRGYDWGYLAGYAWCQDENDSWETGP